VPDLRVMCRVGMVFEYAVPDAECNTEACWSELSRDVLSRTRNDRQVNKHMLL